MRILLRYSLLFVIGVAHCSSAPPPPPQFALDYAAHNPGLQLTPVDASLGVARLNAKAFYTRERVAWRAGDTHQYHAGGKWEDSPAVLFAEAILDAAQESGAFTSAQPYPPAWGAQPTIVVRGRVEAFDDLRGDAGREAVIAAQVALTDAGGRTIYWEQAVEKRQAVGGGGMDALIDAFRTAQSRLAEEIVVEAHRIAGEQVALQAAAAADES